MVCWYRRSHSVEYEKSIYFKEWWNLSSSLNRTANTNVFNGYLIVL